jgi:hypothetical protein
MERMPKVASAAAMLSAVGCVSLTPEQSCTAICDEMQECGVTIEGSSLAAGPSCHGDCLSLINVHGAGCKSTAAYLADCFQTYTCSGIEVSCSGNADSFSTDCS